VSASLTPRVEEWRASGEQVDVDGRRLFMRSSPGAGPPLLLLHGYPSSSYDWRLVLDRLGDRPTACFDFLGFGLSEKPRDHVYSLLEQADLVEGVVRRLGVDEVTLVAHDMGTSVTTELLARDIEGRLPFRLGSVLLLNGSMVLAAASLTPSQKILRSRLGGVAARLSSERGFRRQFKRLFSPDHPLSPEEAADQWSLLAHDDGQRILHRLIYYLHEREAYAERWHGALRDWHGNLRLAWAMLDPVATPNVLNAVLELRPQAPTTRFDDLGHYSQIEDPEAITSLIEQRR
jgi:pimeloyl-ACP methyl ester carboxylesterase